MIITKMNDLVIISVAVLPAFLLWLYVWKKDQKKEPKSLLLKATLYGVFICFPVSLVEMVIESILFSPEGGPTTLLGTTADAFMVAAIPEESFKLLALWLVLRKNPYFDEHFDGIIYAVCVGLGFAAVENILYLFDNMDDWLSVAFMRSLMAVPGHYAFAILMGYYYSRYHFIDHSRKTAALILVAPVIAHGTYDALLMTSMVDELLGLFCFIVTVFLVCSLYLYARKKIMSVIGTDSFLGGRVLKFNTPSPEEVGQDFEIEPNSDEVKSDK